MAMPFYLSHYSSHSNKAVTFQDLKKVSKLGATRTAMSSQNGLLIQKECQYLDQGHPLNDILLRAAHSMAYFHLSQLNLA